VLEDLVSSVPQVQVRFRVFPLSGFCNPVLEPSSPAGTELEIGRCRAALAAHCADQQGRFWEYSDAVFAGQPDLTDDRLFAAARQVGVDPDALRTCMQDPTSAGAVRDDALAGAAMRLQGTPAFFVLGLTPEPIEVCGGVQGVLALLQAQSQGIELPPPTQSACTL
jgi:protein-disulfide isomerase